MDRRKLTQLYLVVFWNRFTCFSRKIVSTCMWNLMNLIAANNTLHRFGSLMQASACHLCILSPIFIDFICPSSVQILDPRISTLSWQHERTSKFTSKQWANDAQTHACVYTAYQSHIGGVWNYILVKCLNVLTHKVNIWKILEGSSNQGN